MSRTSHIFASAEHHGFAKLSFHKCEAQCFHTLQASKGRVTYHPIHFISLRCLQPLRKDTLIDWVVRRCLPGKDPQARLAGCLFVAVKSAI